MAVPQAPIGKVVEAGSLPPWGVGDLPAPPPYTLKNALRVTGAGAIILGISIGSGEWLIGPAVTAQFTAALLWVATGLDSPAVGVQRGSLSLHALYWRADH